MQQNAAEARALVIRLETEHPAFKPIEVRLLRARALELSDTAAALAVYEELIPSYAGLEAKCRYATLLQSLGHQAQGRALFEEVVQHAKRFNISHEAEQEWGRLARANLRS